MSNIADTSDLHEEVKKIADYLRDNGGKGAAVQSAAWGLTFVAKDGCCTFSCQLMPPGHGSTVQDWRFLGALMGQLGVPDTAVRDIITQQEKDPNGVITAQWFEQ